MLLRKSHHGPPREQLNTKSMIIYQNVIKIMISTLTLLLTTCPSAILNEIAGNCRERSRLVENENGDLYTLIDATADQKLTLQCHYCDEHDDGKPKNWYKIEDLGAGEPHEVRPDMNNNSTQSKISISKEHSLVINNLTENDTGLYYCRRFEGEQDEKYNYLVDLVEDGNATSPEAGNFTHWRKYYEEYFVPINALFSQSKGAEFSLLRQQWKIEMEIVTQWGSWGICEVCGRPQNEGIRKKTGFCRIKLTQKNSTFLSSGNKDEKFLKNANRISCKSKVLTRLFPGISNRTRIIPDFVLIEACEGSCSPDAEGLDKGWKAGKTSAFKYRKTLVLPESTHATIVCPESTLDNKVTWKRNGKLLEAGRSVTPPNPEDEPRIIVDTFNTLYLVAVQESEEGNYTCQVDDVRMQQIIVFVVSKSRLLTQAFVRHMMYLCMILSLTLPCYCAGISIACFRKRTFKNYEELKEEEAQKRIGGYMKLP